MKYADIKDNLKNFLGDEKGEMYKWQWEMLCILHAIAGELDSIAYAARLLTKKPRRGKRG